MTRADSVVMSLLLFISFLRVTFMVMTYIKPKMANAAKEGIGAMISRAVTIKTSMMSELKT